MQERKKLKKKNTKVVESHNQWENHPQRPPSLSLSTNETSVLPHTFHKLLFQKHSLLYMTKKAPTNSANTQSPISVWTLEAAPFMTAFISISKAERSKAAVLLLPTP